MTDSRFVLALKYYETGLPEESWKILSGLLQEPNISLDALQLATAVRLEARAFDDAISFARLVLARDPGNVAAELSQTQALFQSGRAREAEQAMTRAASLPGHHPAGWNNLGNLLDELGRPDEAVAAFQRAIAQAPAFSAAHNNLGSTLAGQGRFAAAAAAHRAALEADPRNLAALNNLGVALLEQGLAAEAIAAFEKASAADPSDQNAADNRLYAMIYGEPDPRPIHAAHVTWGKAMPAPTVLRPPNPNPARRLRIGYVSPDFRRHSVSFFAAPLMAHHDAAVVEVFCYSDAIADDVTKRFKAAAHNWRETRALNNDALFKMIRRDQIDILVDLAGHTKGNRLAVFARRAAPVQVTALGYPATTGLPAMDYRSCDDITDPAPDADPWSVETLRRLASGMHCYGPPVNAPMPGPLPAQTAGYVTFGAFNKLAKISPLTVALWARILKQVPSARLLMKTKALAEAETRQRVQSRFAAEGIDAGRLDLRGWLPGDRAHLDLYNEVDIALDTAPYNGTTTTCEALWMGVPVVTLAGQGHASRVGASLLTQVGLTDWIASTPDAYAAHAVKSAEDVTGLVNLRAKLRDMMMGSPLCDARTHARAVEAAYRAMWQRACVSGAVAQQ